MTSPAGRRENGYAIEATISATLLYPIARWSEKRLPESTG